MNGRTRDGWTHSRREVLRVGALAVATGVAGCLDVGGDERTVLMGDEFAFDPRSIRVDSGETVVWENDDDVGHTVTAYEDAIPDGATYFASGGFESERAARNAVSDGLIAPGETFEHTFEVAGTYEYYCIPHESGGMVGEVVVQ